MFEDDLKMKIIEVTLDPKVAEDILAQLDFYLNGNRTHQLFSQVFYGEMPARIEPGKSRNPEGCRVLLGEHLAQQIILSAKSFEIDIAAR